MDNFVHNAANKTSEFLQYVVVADALSRKCLLMQEFRVKTLGFDDLRDMYADDQDFKQAYEAAENPFLKDRSPWTDYMI